MIKPSITAPSELNFTDADFQVIARFAASQYGLDIKMEKKGLIYARLARRIRTLGLPNFKAYCDLATGPKSGNEGVELLSALTTNVSSFFRERHHFDLLRTNVLPALRSRAESQLGLRIWSAGCSAGQEAYSIGATIQEIWPDADRLNIQILATDVDPRILDKARAAKYRHSDVSGLATQQIKQIFEPPSQDANDLVVKASLRKLVQFDQVNLVSDWRHRQPFDFIFCRNVVIYFERTTQHRLWQRFSDTLTETGHLFIGHSERLTGPAETHFRNVGITAFTKTTR